MSATDLSRPVSLRERVWLIVAVFLALAVVVGFLPKWLGAGRPYTGPNETAAIATLRNLGSAQDITRQSRKVDVDGDSQGEYGTFAEMTAATGVRISAGGSSRGPRIEPPTLSPSLAPRADRPFVARSGYCFRIFLPSGPSTAVSESDPGKPLSSPVATDLAESHWCAYAWPKEYGSSGWRAFYTDETGAIWWCRNEGRRYGGYECAPAWDAALPTGAPRAWTTRRSAGGPGTDGETWEDAK